MFGRALSGRIRRILIVFMSIINDPGAVHEFICSFVSLSVTMKYCISKSVQGKFIEGC